MNNVPSVSDSLLGGCEEALRRRRVICGGVHSLGNMNKIADPANAQNITQKKSSVH
jgi:hypothetical protein